MGPGNMGPGGGQPSQHMQQRLDLMQRMMEQMQNRLQLMLKRDGGS